jgi:hypothetical protein
MPGDFGAAFLLGFSDGLGGEFDRESKLWGEVFEPLRDPVMFRQVTVDQVAGTIVWPTGADFDPEGPQAHIARGAA